MSDDPATQALVRQCADKWERCQYTSASLFIWLRWLRIIRIPLVILPIVFGTLAGWDLLKAKPEYALVTSLLAMMAGLIPAIYAALKLDEHIPTTASLAGEYKNLELTFDDLRILGAHEGIDKFRSAYDAAIVRLEKANAIAYTAPQWCFRRAQKQVGQGSYETKSQQSPGS